MALEYTADASMTVTRIAMIISVYRSVFHARFLSTSRTILSMTRPSFLFSLSNFPTGRGRGGSGDETSPKPKVTRETIHFYGESYHVSHGYLYLSDLFPLPLSWSRVYNLWLEACTQLNFEL